MTTRRTWLQAMGLGGVATVAGCVAAPSQSDPETPDETASRDPAAQAAATDVDRVAADPTDLPPPIDRDHAETVAVTLRPEEVTAEIEPGVTFDFMTYNGQVPGPFIRVRQGDTVDLTFENPSENNLPHNVDFHACAGPGGGATATMTAPGETARLRFKATYPGAFIYHCAVPNLDMHISAGMFGIILVEPPEGLPAVDRECYFGQHEVYTKSRAGEAGHHTFDVAAMRDEHPTYVLINGGKYAITDAMHGPVTANTDEDVRVFFGVGGPNLSSSFHPIGSVFDEYWPQGAVASAPHRYVQTWTVPPGSTGVGVLNSPVPGPVKLVDHSLSRVARKGTMAVIDVQGPEDPEVFDPNA